MLENVNSWMPSQRLKREAILRLKTVSIIQCQNQVRTRVLHASVYVHVHCHKDADLRTHMTHISCTRTRIPLVHCLKDADLKVFLQNQFQVWLRNVCTCVYIYEIAYDIYQTYGSMYIYECNARNVIYDIHVYILKYILTWTLTFKFNHMLTRTCPFTQRKNTVFSNTLSSDLHTRTQTQIHTQIRACARTHTC